MKILMRFEVEKDLNGVDDPEEAELIAKELGNQYRKYGLKYKGVSISPEIHYQLNELKEIMKQFEKYIF